MAHGPTGVARSQKGPEGPPHLIEMSPMTKYDQKVYCYSVLAGSSIFRLQRFRCVRWTYVERHHSLTSVCEGIFNKIRLFLCYCYMCSFQTITNKIKHLLVLRCCYNELACPN